MSRRNSLENKHLRREAKKQRKQLPAYIDLIQWMKLRQNITTGTAIKLLLAGVLRADSHKLGFVQEKKRVTLKLIAPAGVRDRITIHAPEEPDVTE